MAHVRLVDTLDRLRTALAGRYAVEREIGRGGMAIVYLAEDLKHHRPVAIKVLKPEFALALSSDRFLREIQIEAQLKHPYILPLFDSGEAEGLLYYVMPYVSGQSLRHRLDGETQLPLDEALRITAETAEALGYAHTRGVVHRDVKPGNILLDESHALLADFGIARVVSQLAGSTLSESGIAVGTPEYMSPEQCSGGGKVDGRSDIYALGCVLYEMLSGEPPFTGPTPQAVVARHMYDHPRSLRVVRDTIPMHVERAIQVALAKAPGDRYPSASGFAAALTGKRPVHPITLIREAGRPRGRKLAKLGTALAALAVVLGGLWAIGRSTSTPGAGATAATASPSSIAVLYFEDRSEDNSLGYLSAGFTEDLIDQLASVKSLRVISPNGVRPYRSRDAPLDSITEALQVGTIVTGTLDRSGDRLRASVRLMDGSGVQLYGGSFEKPFTNVLALRDQLADEVARQLRVRLGQVVHLQERKAATRNPMAWDLVQRAEQLRAEVLALALRDSAASSSLFQQADGLLARAESLDRSWPEPSVLRGWLDYDQADRAAGSASLGGLRTNQAVVSWIDRGIRHAENALRKEPASPEALELRGSLLYRGWALTSMAGARDTTNQLERAERDLRAAANVTYRYQPRALSTLSAVQQLLGKLSESNLAAQRAYEADAYLRDASGIVFRLFLTSFHLERYAEAGEWCHQGQQSFPREWPFLMCRLSLMGWSPLVQPKVSQAWSVMNQLDTIAAPEVLTWLRPEMTMMVATVLARIGLRDSAESVIARANKAAPADTRILYYEALARVRLGQRERAAALLQELIRRNPNFATTFRSDPAFKSLWRDPRLAAIS
jgi:serine/threonine protein kinase/tetratricopeptide (TPR) repeat protein